MSNQSCKQFALNFALTGVFWRYCNIIRDDGRDQVLESVTNLRIGFPYNASEDRRVMICPTCIPDVRPRYRITIHPTLEEAQEGKMIRGLEWKHRRSHVKQVQKMPMAPMDAKSAICSDSRSVSRFRSE